MIKYSKLIKKMYPVHSFFAKLCFVFFMLLAVHLSAFAQGQTVSGMIKDAGNEPLPGVSVSVKGTNIGTVTGADGKYSVSVPGKNAVLEFTFLGYKTKEMPVGNQTRIDLTMSEDTQALDEVVVIGYGTVRKSDLTGAVASVSERQFKEEPVKRIEDVLQGRMAGVEVISENGTLGGSFRVRVRGTGSINKSSDPIYVVDGILSTSGLDGLNMSDIQSIEVLKDASATAVYGSRGANGVVLVTTKRGAEGKPQITFEGSYGWSKIAKMYDLMNAYEYATAIRDVGNASQIPDADYEKYKDGTLGVNWIDLMTQTGLSQDYKLSVSGSSGKTRYFVSGQVLDQSGTIILSHHNRYQFRTNLETEVTKWFSIKTNLNAGIRKLHNGGGDLSPVMGYSPTMPIMDPAHPNYYNSDPINSIVYNPYGIRKLNPNDSYGYMFNGNVSLVFKLMDGLKFTTQGGLNFRNGQNYQFSSQYVKFGSQSGMSNFWDSSLYWQNTNNLTYEKKTGDHSITATAVWELSKSEYKSIGISGGKLANEEMVGYWNVRNAITPPTASNEYSAETMASGVFRVMYSYKDRYLLTGTLRADGSSKFAKQNKWGYFPSAAAAWDVAKEDFFKAQNFFRQLKLRAGYGVVGNSGINRYDTLGTLSSGSYGWGTATRYSGYWSNTFPMPGIRWEKSLSTDLALDYSILKGRVNGSIDRFVKRTTDLLFRRTVPAYNGGGAFWDNLGEVKNSGIEITVNATPVNTKDFTWETGFNATYIKSEIVDMGGETLIRHATQSNYGGSMMAFSLGHPVNAFYLQQFAGYNDQGGSLYYLADGSTSTKPGGVDQVVKGQADPAWNFGFNNSLNWKNWSANILVTASTGFQKLNLMRYRLAGMNGEYRFTRLRDSYFKSWDKVDNKADAKYPTLKNANTALGTSDFWLEDASFMKVKNVQLAYTIPKNVLKFASATLSFNVQNLFTLTKYQGLDPETYSNWAAQAGMSGAPGGMSGIDIDAYPTSRTYTLGLKLNF